MNYHVHDLHTQGNMKNYKVQWAPTWVSEIYLIGCERLITQFTEDESAEVNNNGVESDTKDETEENTTHTQQATSTTVAVEDANMTDSTEVMTTTPVVPRDEMKEEDGNEDDTPPVAEDITEQPTSGKSQHNNTTDITSQVQNVVGSHDFVSCCSNN